MGSKVYPSQYAAMPTGDLENINTDRSVDWPTMVRGQMYKTSAGWTFWDGNSRSTDAAFMRVSAVGGSTVTFDGDATNNRVSAFQTDAGKLRVSALGVTATMSPLSSDSSSVSAFQDLANRFRVSAFSLVANEMVVSAVQSDATLTRISAFSDNASTMRVSAFGDFEVDFHEDAADNRVSAIQSAANLLRTSSFSLDGGTLRVSAVQEGAGVLRVSTFSQVANAMVVSTAQSDAGVLRTSSYIPVDTVGGVSIFRSLSLSASQAVKATAGAIYGYYLYNTTTTPQYVKLTNTSGAINVGTDVPVAHFMLPASAAANVWFGQGLKGFTAGIGVHATSAVADNATTPAAASAVGGMIFFN